MRRLETVKRELVTLTALKIRCIFNGKSVTRVKFRLVSALFNDDVIVRLQYK